VEQTYPKCKPQRTSKPNSRAVGPRKDTVTVVPLQTVVADLIADNPGRWLAHCHNLYHSMCGMMALLDYDV
jgi:FtsP/CotA-like multicopper oxidase with cupredoxin domain